MKILKVDIITKKTAKLKYNTKNYGYLRGVWIFNLEFYFVNNLLWSYSKKGKSRCRVIMINKHLSSIYSVLFHIDSNIILFLLVANRMLNLGMAVIVFLAIAVVVMALFCLITRYFNKKLDKALDDQNQIYSMIQQIRGAKGENDQDGEYESYLNKKQLQQMKSGQKKNNFELQLTQTKQPLKGYGQDIHSKGRLKSRLQGETIPLNPQTGRSKNSLKSFRPERLDESRRPTLTNRSKNSQDNFDPNQSLRGNLNDTSPNKKNDKKKKKQNITKHTYVSKIVSYVQQGVFIIENNLISLTKKGQMIQKRNTKNSSVKPEQNSFEDTLQAYGFEKGSYCAFKFETTVQIPHMKDGEEYPVASLKGTESKQPIEFVQFYNLKDKLEQIF